MGSNATSRSGAGPVGGRRKPLWASHSCFAPKSGPAILGRALVALQLAHGGSDTNILFVYAADWTCPTPALQYGVRIGMDISE